MQKAIKFAQRVDASLRRVRMGQPTVAVRSVMYTREQWASDLLVYCGNTKPLAGVVNFVAAWTLLETASPPHQGAAYNLLNTRHKEGVKGDTTPYNTTGVLNFSSYRDGLQGNSAALHDGFYPTLLAALLANDVAALGVWTTPIPALPSIQAELSKWCGGCDYGKRIPLLVGQHLTDSFQGLRQPPVIASRALLLTIEMWADGSVHVMGPNGNEIA